MVHHADDGLLSVEGEDNVFFGSVKLRQEFDIL